MNMNMNMKMSVICGSILLCLAAFVSISLLTWFSGSAQNMFLFSGLGALLGSAYGYSSIGIVFFFLSAALLCFLPDWSLRRGVYLVSSIFPFFTLVGAEKIARIFLNGSDIPFLGYKISAVFVVAALLIAIEYVLASYISEYIQLVPALEDEAAADNTRVSAEAESVSVGDEKSVVEEAVQTIAETQSDFMQAADLEEDPLVGTMPDISLIEESCCFDDLPDLQDEFLDEETADEPDSLAEETEFEDGLTTAEYAYLVKSVLNPEEQEALYGTELNEETAAETVATDDEQKSDMLFLDLNWQQHNSLPVRTCDEETDERLTELATESECKEEELDDPFAVIDDIHTIEELEEMRELEQLDEGVETTEPVCFDVPAIPVFSDKPTGSSAIKSAVPLQTNQYRIPSDELLNTYPDGEYWIVDAETQRSAAILKETLSEFKIEAEVTGIRKGPVITMFEILPAPGVKLTKIVALQDNIALRLAASSVRIVAPIPGKHAVGIEVPNKERFIVSFRELIDTDTALVKKMEIPVVLGKDITGEGKLLDLASTPHLLIAGSTGSGKSVCVNSLILSILYKRSPQEVKMILIDPKIVELKLYNDIPHLLTPVITEPKKAFQALQYCLCEMERRYAMLDRMGVRDIRSYNRRITERNLVNEKLPYIVVIIDEFADLMATTGKELESTVARLAAMSRAIGVHLVLATQRPSIDVITGLIKANIPTRIAFMVASKMDSRIIIDQVGAEKLLGKGDMLYSPATDPFPLRIQGTYVSEEEVERVVAYVKQYGEPEYIDEEIFVDDDEEAADPSLFGDGEDPLYDKALEIVLQAGKASASYIQRRLKIGYNRAARLVEEMEQRGIVGPANGSKPREVVHVPR